MMMFLQFSIKVHSCVMCLDWFIYFMYISLAEELATKQSGDSLEAVQAEDQSQKNNTKKPTSKF